MHEAKLYNKLAGCPGIPTVHWSGVEDEHNVMIMDLLGPSLEDLFNYCDRHFSLKTVLMIADQIISLIEYIHSKNFIHRDIKAENFLMGTGACEKQLFIIDFGLARKFRDPQSQQHIPYKEHRGLTGTARYASINTHMGIEQSRRDDLEAIGYMLVYFNRGILPWQGVRAATKEEKYQKIGAAKQATSPDVLCKNIPDEFATFLTYCQNLEFEARPSYAFFRMILKDLLIRERYQNDLIFDWDIRVAQTREEQEARYGKNAVEDEDLAAQLQL